MGVGVVEKCLRRALVALAGKQEAFCSQRLQGGSQPSVTPLLGRFDAF